jgi:hypothetical protein
MNKVLLYPLALIFALVSGHPHAVLHNFRLYGAWSTDPNYVP